MRRYEIITMLCLLITFMTIMTTVNAEQAIIKADQLNVRAGPGTHFDSIDKVNTDEIYQIIQIEGDWVEIQMDDGSGWVTTDYITIEQQSEKEVIVEEEEIEIINTQENEPSHKASIIISNENTQIRKGPSVDHEIIQYASKDQEFDIISENENWYEINTDNGTGHVFKELVDNTQLTTANHLNNKTIVIDAGHGGRDVGAISINDNYEKDITLKTTIELERALTTLGAHVILTRNKDDYIRLASRPMLANVYDADAFISIHYNSFIDSTSVNGIDTYYYDDYDKHFATIIQNELIHETGANDRGFAYGDFQVLRQSLQPSLLLELGFISNHEQEQLLLTDVYQGKVVKGITTGLTKYFAK